jgi:hypothetical protein
VAFSNIAVTLEGNAATHFGMPPLHGVVRLSDEHDEEGH